MNRQQWKYSQLTIPVVFYDSEEALVFEFKPEKLQF